MAGRLTGGQRGWSTLAALALMTLLPAVGASSRAAAATTRWVGVAVAPGGGGYWMVGQDGAVVARGNVVSHGSLAGGHLNRPIAGISATPTGNGYWLVASDGGIFTFGDATYLGSTGAIHLNQPIVGMAATATGRGYWLVASDGGIFTFGDATYLGSTGAIHLNQPIVGMAATATGRGYWLVASDGGIFTFGDATYLGSTGAIHLNQPIVGMAPSPSGFGYWLVASDGGIFTFGNATYFGSTGAIHLNQPIVGIVASSTGGGYTLGAADASAFQFGDAASPRPQLTMFGRSGSFGQLAGLARVSTGQTISTVGIPGWNFHAGQAAYFTAVAQNGDVLIANEPQTDNQASPTSADLVISVFDPRTQSFANVTVPTTSGQLSAKSPGQPTGGGDVSDLTVLPNGQVAFTSAVPYHGWNVWSNGRYPTLGILDHSSGTWTFNPGSSRTADDMAASSPSGAAACPTTVDPAMHPLAQCQGANELARLPISGDLVVTLYFNDPASGRASGAILVLDPTGRVLTSYQYPNIPGPGGTTLSVHPREVDADPTSVTGDERFAVVFDVFPADGASSLPGLPFTLQEFSFNGTAVVPRSAPVVTGDRIGPAPAGIETASTTALAISGWHSLRRARSMRRLLGSPEDLRFPQARQRRLRRTHGLADLTVDASLSPGHRVT